MTFATPLPFAEALAQLQRRGVLPTNLSTAQMRALNDKWHRQSFSSAQTLLTDLLDSYKAKIETILNPERVERPPGPGRDTGAVVTEGLNFAKAREQTKALLREIGYSPNPDERGTILDLSSDKRIDLVLKTNVAVAQGEGYFLQGQDPAILDEFPAQELFRASPRDKERNWNQRWMIAAQVAGDVDAARVLDSTGRMIALKDSGIWQAMGDGAGGYQDTLGNPFEPFAFNSGMGTRDIARDEAEKLGLILPGETVEPQILKEAA